MYLHYKSTQKDLFNLAFQIDYTTNTGKLGKKLYNCTKKKTGEKFQQQKNMKLVYVIIVHTTNTGRYYMH